jgi:hypothetical protein
MKKFVESKQVFHNRQTFYVNESPHASTFTTEMPVSILKPSISHTAKVNAMTARYANILMNDHRNFFDFSANVPVAFTDVATPVRKSMTKRSMVRYTKTFIGSKYAAMQPAKNTRYCLGGKSVV